MVWELPWSVGMPSDHLRRKWEFQRQFRKGWNHVFLTASHWTIFWSESNFGPILQHGSLDFPFEGWNNTWNDVWISLQRPFFVQETMDPWTKLLIMWPSLYTNKNLTMKHHFSDISYWKPINPSSPVVYPSLRISSNDLGESLWTHRLTSPWEDSQREQTQNGPTFQLWNRCNDLPRTVVYSQNWRANLQAPPTSMMVKPHCFL
jgi:hypothetical protein